MISAITKSRIKNGNEDLTTSPNDASVINTDTKRQRPKGGLIISIFAITIYRTSKCIKIVLDKSSTFFHIFSTVTILCRFLPLLSLSIFPCRPLSFSVGAESDMLLS